MIMMWVVSFCFTTPLPLLVRGFSGVFPEVRSVVLGFRDVGIRVHHSRSSTIERLLRVYYESNYKHIRLKIKVLNKQSDEIG